jgi:hypothetical protein
MLKDLINSRRLKILYLPEQAVLGMFDRVKPHDWIRRPFFALPEGTTVIKSYYCPERPAYGFLLHNPTWEAVTSNEIPPELFYLETVLQVPKICDFCKKKVPMGEFCNCKIPDEKILRTVLVADGKEEADFDSIPKSDIIGIVDSKGCEKLCPRCQTRLAYYTYLCPKCHYTFD